ncbi:hypothetical protein [Nitrospira sp. Nam74]
MSTITVPMMIASNCSHAAFDLSKVPLAAFSPGDLDRQAEALVRTWSLT